LDSSSANFVVQVKRLEWPPVKLSRQQLTFLYRQAERKGLKCSGISMKARYQFPAVKPPMKTSTSGESSQWAVKRLLVIDDDVELCELLAEYLLPEGFRVEAVQRGDGGLERALSGEFALIILDVMLPRIKGYEVLRRIRAQSQTPVIMLTARGEEVDRILGLEIGADDYVPKPFNPRELLARIQAVLRRSSPGANDLNPPAPVHVIFGDIELDEGRRVARCGKRGLELTSVEFELLSSFIRAPGQVIEREELVKSVLGRELSPFDRSIDVHVSNLRRKLGPAPDGEERIKAIRSVGYLFIRDSVK
jgi:DNA-binding response OmpR family regulator